MILRMDKAKLVPDGSDGINGVILANAMYLSGWPGKTVFVDIGGTCGSK